MIPSREDSITILEIQTIANTIHPNTTDTDKPIKIEQIIKTTSKEATTN
jgi:hypothetical protein